MPNERSFIRKALNITSRPVQLPSHRERMCLQSLSYSYAERAIQGPSDGSTLACYSARPSSNTRGRAISICTPLGSVPVPASVGSKRLALGFNRVLFGTSTRWTAQFR
jgi:hypothetical protein